MQTMKIRQKRDELGLSQIELSSRVGVAQSVISAWEHETYLPKARQLPLLARALSCSIEDLFEQEEEVS